MTVCILYMHLSCIQVNYHPENSLSWRLLTWYRRRCLKCAAPLGFACPSGSKAAGRLHCLPQLGFPPLHSHCWIKFQAETMSRSRGMICPQLPPPSRRAAHLLCVASPGGLKETESMQGEDFLWVYSTEHSLRDPCEPSCFILNNIFSLIF